MRAKIGDVVIDRTYDKRGRLAIVVGEGISQPILIYHKGDITMDKLSDYFAIWDGLEVIGHIDFERIWEEAVRKADRKTEPQTNADQHVQHVQHVESVETMSCQECKHWIFTSQWGWFCPLKGQDECHYEPIEDDLQTDCLTCRYNSDEWDSPKCDGCSKADSHYEPKDEPQLTPNYCGTCKHREVPCGDLPCDVCHGYSNYEPKDEPQKKYPTEWCEECDLWRENNCMGIAQCKANMKALMEIEELYEPQTDCAWK